MNLREAVLELILDETWDYSPEEALKWVESCRCAAGRVNDLIYFDDTVKFFNTYEDEILDLHHDCDIAMEIGQFESMQDFKNRLAWNAFELLKDDVYEEHCENQYHLEKRGN